MAKRPPMKENDIVIIVTGTLRSGKSTVVNALLAAESEKMAVGEKMTCCTTEIDYAVIDPIPANPKLKGRRLIIVDTPGFDNSNPNLSDTAILRKIADWLLRHFSDKITLGGVIYLHDITISNSSSLAPNNLTMLRASFGDFEPTFEKVAFATTKWDRVKPDDGSKTEDNLRDVWDDFIQRGSELHRVKSKGDADGAWGIVNALLCHGIDDSTLDTQFAAKLKKFRKTLQTSPGGKANGNFSFHTAFLELFGWGNRSAAKTRKAS